MVLKYPNLLEILKGQVSGMVAGALDYNHNYYLLDGGILYKDNDTISKNLNYGYKTVFANIYEYKRKNITNKNY